MTVEVEPTAFVHDNIIVVSLGLAVKFVTVLGTARTTLLISNAKITLTAETDNIFFNIELLCSLYEELPDSKEEEYDTNGNNLLDW